MCVMLKEANAELKANMRNAKNEHDKIVEIVEDNKNRQLRKTLVFKGIPEQQFETEGKTNPDGSPKMRPENWSETANILATSMSEILDTTFEKAIAMVERCNEQPQTRVIKEQVRAPFSLHLRTGGIVKPPKSYIEKTI